MLEVTFLCDCRPQGSRPWATNSRAACEWHLKSQDPVRLSEDAEEKQAFGCVAADRCAWGWQVASVGFTGTGRAGTN